MEKARDKPYIWVTWITGLLSGEKQCEWAAWFKAHFKGYDELPDDGEARLSQWKAEHAQFVAARAKQMEADGWKVSLEGQNKFTVEGKTATVGGMMDLVSRKPGLVHIEDMKGGKKREEHFWQVIIYMALGIIAGVVKKDEAVSGAVVYREDIRRVSADDAKNGAPLVSALVKRIGGNQELRRVPSWNECRYCKIAKCPDRAGSDRAASGTTQEF